MPMYDLTCPTHGFIEDTIFRKPVVGSVVPCPECGADSKKGIHAMTPIGVIFSNAIVSNTSGINLDTNEKLRKFETENPGSKLVDTKSKYWAKKKDRLHERRHDRVKKMGYKDFADFGKQRKAAKRSEAAAKTAT